MTAPLPRSLTIVRWVGRGVAMVGTALVFTLPGDAAMLARMAFLLPALVPMAIAEFIVSTAHSKAACEQFAKDHGLEASWSLLTSRIQGLYRNHAISFVTESRNELLPGTCLEVTAPELKGLALGPPRIKRALKKSISEPRIEIQLPQSTGLAAWSDHAHWQTALLEGDLMLRVTRLCLPSTGSATQCAVLNGRVIRAHYGSKLSSAELKVFIDEAIDLIEAIAPKR